MNLVVKDIKNSVHEDIFIIQTINTIDDLTHVTNKLVKRLREWYSYYFPELDDKIEDHEKLQSGDIVVFASVGAGMNINSMVYKVP